MASPQLEEGFVAIAYDLFAALAAAKLSGLEKEVVLAVIYFTYGSGKTKAAIENDDIQVFVAGDRRIRNDRVEAAITSLVEKNVLYVINLNQHQRIMGVQKDFEKWGQVLNEKTEGTDRESGQKFQVLRSSNNKYINTITTSRRDKLSTLQEYAYRNTDFKYGPSAWGVERKFARLLYKEALLLTGEPRAALIALKDYIDELQAQEWFAGVKMRLSYMHSRFRQWLKSIPAKPRDIREQEEITGYRFKYINRRWEMSNEQISTR